MTIGFVIVSLFFLALFGGMFLAVITSNFS